MKFCIRAEFLDAKLLVFTLPEQTQTQKNIYGNFANFNPWAIVNTSYRRTMHCKIVHYTRQHFARAIVDEKTLQSLFVNISPIFQYQPSHFEAITAIFLNAVEVNC